jgi:putative sigma-54 modulation protein
MHVSFTFKNLDPSQSLKSYAQEKLDRFDRLLDNPAEASVVFTVEKFRHLAEVNITGDRLSINGKEETGDMYSAIDMVLDKLEKQIKKSKDKSRKRRISGKSRDRQRQEEASVTLGASDDADESKVIVQTIEYKPMDVDEALLQLDLVDDAFMVFTNARTGRINVLYRRSDGNIGLIEPST